MVSVQFGYGQCVPNPSHTTPLFYPDTSSMIPCIEQGIPYAFDLQIRNYGVVSSTVSVEWLRIDSIKNLPQGINWSMNVPQGNLANTLNLDENGCIHFSGTTNSFATIYETDIYVCVKLNLFANPLCGPLDSLILQLQALVPLPMESLVFTVVNPGGFCPAGTGISSQISGKVYYDENNNGAYDSNDFPFANSQIQLSPVPFSLYTNNNGDYLLYTTSTNASLTIVPPHYFTFSSNATLTFNSITPGQIITGADFGLVADTVIHDVSVSITQSPARPGFITTMWIDLQNGGTQFENGTVQLTYDSLLTYESSSTAFSSHTNNILEFPYTNLSPGEQRRINVEFRVPVDVNLLGDTLTSYVSVLNQNIEHNEEDNIGLVEQVITGSYDPNDKNYSPFNKIFKEGVAPGDDIVYTIRFQNTGTDTAFTIVIRDTLNPNVFDLPSFKPIGSSHTYSLKLNDNGELSWTFNNILLPDSGVNEPGSHGYVKFSVAIKNNLAHQTPILNTAAIYFDYNPPIITNTSTTRVNIYLSTNDLMDKVVGLKIYPNPASQIINIQTDNVQSSIKSVIIYDVTGKAMQGSTSITITNATIDVSNLSNGLYFLHVEMSNGQRSVRKVVKE